MASQFLLLVLFLSYSPTQPSTSVSVYWLSKGLAQNLSGKQCIYKMYNII